MTDRLIVRRDSYFDSVTLMLASRDAEQIEGVSFAVAVTATPVNVDLLRAQGFEVDDAGSSDLVIAIKASDESAAEEAERAVAVRLAPGGAPGERPAEEIAPRSFRSAARRSPTANLAFVSVPGRYATYEVADALEAGFNVFCFSDGLSLDDEAALKRRAIDRGLLLMGADCGTAIIDGIALGFANDVASGPVGIVGASGTGIQQVTCLLDRAGIGTSHAIGVGGRDLSRAVGGPMTVRGIELLGGDEATEVIVVISKPPDPTVASKIADAAGKAGKPVVLGLLGRNGEIDAPFNVTVTSSLESAAVAAARIAGGHIDVDERVAGEEPRGFIRGLFSGGSLCYEAMGVVAGAAGPVYSNVPLDPSWRLDDVDVGREHSFWDFGEDEFTQGRAHPMIDPSLRNARFEREAADETVSAVVLDLVLGYGAHPDPAAELAGLVESALARRDDLTVVVSVCGTDGDPQDASAQRERLDKAGAITTFSAAHAGRLALGAGARNG